MTDQTPPSGEVLFPRWLIVVRRDQNTLYENLVLTFKSTDRIDVLVDRRETDLRSAPRPIKSERRRRLTAKERALWRHVGFRVIYIAGEPEPRPEAATVPRRPPRRATSAHPHSRLGRRPRTPG